MMWNWELIKGIPGFLIGILTLISMLVAAAWSLREYAVSQEQLNESHCKLSISIKYNEAQITQMLMLQAAIDRKYFKSVIEVDKNLNNTEREKKLKKIDVEITQHDKLRSEAEKIGQKIDLARKNQNIWVNNKCVSLD